MKYIILFLTFLSGVMFLIGLIMLNLSWIVFLLIFVANIFFDKGYPLFALYDWSLFGTPLEFFIGGIIIMAVAYICHEITYRLEIKYYFN